MNSTNDVRIGAISLIGAFVLFVATTRAISPLPAGSYPNEITADIDDVLTTSPFVREHVVSGIPWGATMRSRTALSDRR